MIDKKIYKIYKLTCLITNMSYIGRTCKNVFKRINQHIVTNSFIGEALYKYEPKNFKLEILWITIDKKVASKIEKAAIDFYNSIHPNGYNATRSGSGGSICNGKKFPEHSKRMQGNKYAQGYKHTKEAIEKIRKAHQGKKFTKKHIEKIIKARENYKHTEETRKKISKSRRGKHHSEETKRKIGKRGEGRLHLKRTKLKMAISRIKYCLRKEEPKMDRV